MRIRQLIVAMLGLGASSFAGHAVTAAQEPKPVPLAGEPRHHVVYESAAIRVHDIQIPPGDTTLFHTHDTAILYVPIARSTNRNQVLGGEWTGGAAPPAVPPPAPAPDRPGPVNSVITYVEKPYTHRVNNVGTSLFRLVGIANRTPGANGAADDVSGLSAKPELENNWYRAHRVVLAPGTASASHRHATQVVLVMQTAGTVAVEGATWSPLNGSGDFVWQAPGAHVVYNRGQAPIELVEVEVRGAQ